MDSEISKKKPRKRPKPSNDVKKNKTKNSVNTAKKKKRSFTKRSNEQLEHKKKKPVQKKTVKKTATKKKNKRRKKRKNAKVIIIELLGAIAITSVLVYLLSLFFFTLVKVEGYSMVPTLRDGDVVYVNKRARIQTFDLVYIKHSGTGEKDIRRVIGLPDQTITYKNDQLEIDGTTREEKFILEQQQTAIENGRLFTDDLSILSLTGETRIPKGKYFVLGDNRPYSTDSRSYGLVDAKDIVGVVEVKIFPLHQVERF